MKHLLELGSRRYTTKLKMRTGLPGISAAVSLLDILLLGMLFFARSSKETRLAGLQVNVPQVKNAATKNISFLQKNIISLVPSEKSKEPYVIFFQNRQVELLELQEELQKLKQQKPGQRKAMVLLMVDRSVAFEHVASVLAVIGNAGLKCYLPVIQQKESQDQSFDKQ